MIYPGLIILYIHSWDYVKGNAHVRYKYRVVLTSFSLDNMMVQGVLMKAYNSHIHAWYAAGWHLEQTKSLHWLLASKGRTDTAFLQRFHGVPENSECRYSDVIMGAMASEIISLTGPLIQAHTKENIKAPRHWTLCGEFTGENLKVVTVTFR